ncbi:hypothetical protein BH09GEM1_BH09GEM1_20890 [soil metagenome]
MCLEPQCVGFTLKCCSPSVTSVSSVVNMLYLFSAKILLGSLLASASLHAQPAPYHRYLTLDTRHFHVHVPVGLEREGRVAGAAAERAYAQLAAELKEPRGPIDLVVTDDADYSNGYATPVPTNRIVVFATPPVESGALRLNEDWLGMVITHELTHIFHLDRVSGVWSLAQHVFGRAPALFPNSYGPSWLTEGLAVYYESRLTEGGRLKDAEFAMFARAAALDHRFPDLNALSLGSPLFPGGNGAYGFGALFVDYLAHTRGDSSIRRLVDAQSSALIPYWLNHEARIAFGTSFESAYGMLRDSIQRTVGERVAPLPGWQQLTTHGYYALDPRWLSDSALVYAANDGRSTGAAYNLQMDGTRRRIGRRNTLGPSIPLRGGGFLFAQVEFESESEIRSDLYVERDGVQRRLTHGMRLVQPDVRGDGTIVAVQIAPSRTRLVLLDSSGRVNRVFRDAVPDETWSEPRWSPDGASMAVLHRTHGGTFTLEVLDLATGASRVLDRGSFLIASPSWEPDGLSVLYTSEEFGTPAVATVRADGRSARAFVSCVPSSLYPETGIGHPLVIPAKAGIQVEPSPEMVPRVRGNDEQSKVNLARSAGSGRTPASSQGANPLASDAHSKFGMSCGTAGLYSAEVAPNGERIAAIDLRSNGYHIGVAPHTAASSATTTEPQPDLAQLAPIDSQPLAAGDYHDYSAWRSALPTYWYPVVEDAPGGGTRIGFTTSGRDILYRHRYDASASIPTNGIFPSASFNYRYAGFRRPFIDASLLQDYTYEANIASGPGGGSIGTLLRKVQFGSLSTTFTRPRARTYAAMSVGVGLEHRSFVSDPGSVYASLEDPAYTRDYTFPSAFLSGQWSNLQRPSLSISPEDGISVALTGRVREQSGSKLYSASTSLVGTAAGYKSLDLPGFAHHVLALRLAGGVADSRTSSSFSIGGTSGTSIQLVPGYSVGEGRRTFGVRGFPAGTVFGTRAAGATAEYRAPLALGGRGLGLLPFFFDRASITAFTDAAVATCHESPLYVYSCSGSPFIGRTIASSGAELVLSAAILDWDSPQGIRVGFAVPTAGRNLVKSRIAAYLAYGLSF